MHTPPLSPYRFGLVWPSRHPKASETMSLLGPRTMGIEVTDPDLAMQCGLGNLDPQHGGTEGDPLAAIEAALSHPLPPEDATLVTVRPDPDALGAMAVLHLRHLGAPLSGLRLRRIRQVAKWDRFDMGSWHDWRKRNPPLPERASLSDVGGSPRAVAMLAALASDTSRTIEERVLATARFLADGEQDRAAMASVAWFREDLRTAWNSGAIAVSHSPDPRIVSVRASHPGALRLGYRWAPVVIAEGQVGGRRKLTVAQFETGWADFTRLSRNLSGLEPGWGGSATILGSPQGASSGLSLEQMIAELRSCMSDRTI